MRTETDAGPQAAGLIGLRPLPPNPLVSVLMTSYNHARFIGRALDSLLRQTYEKFEIIICDDGSSDNTAQVVAGYSCKDSRIRFGVKRNGGQASAMNEAFHRSAGEIICLCDSDDLFAPRKLERVVDTFALKPECGLISHDISIVNAQDKTLRIRTVTPRSDGYLGHKCHLLSRENPLQPCCGLCFRRDVMHAIFPLPETFRTDADSLISGPAAYMTVTGIIPEVLSSWRIHGANSGADGMTLDHLSTEWLENRLEYAERLLEYTREFVERRLGISYDMSCFRPVLEFRMALGILRGDRMMARSAARRLVRAYRECNIDYPLSRFLFWQTLTRVPRPIEKSVLRQSYKIFQRWALRAPSSNL